MGTVEVYVAVDVDFVAGVGFEGGRVVESKKKFIIVDDQIQQQTRLL